MPLAGRKHALAMALVADGGRGERVRRAGAAGLAERAPDVVRVARRQAASFGTTRWKSLSGPAPAWRMLADSCGPR